MEGWGDRDLDDGFRNNGQRVGTYVAIAKTLGEPAYVGALQANFGDDRPGDADEGGAWAEVVLDVNDDGVIDTIDLLAAEAGAPRPRMTVPLAAVAASSRTETNARHGSAPSGSSDPASGRGACQRFRWVS